MKTGQIWLHIILACVALLTLPATGHAQLTFITNNGAITITGYTNLASNAVVVIPGKTNGWSVTSIKDSAFSYDTNLTSVSIPDSVTNIGYSAFYYCTGMTNVAIGTNVQTIASSAFESCWHLHSVTIPKSVTNVGDELFQYSGLGSVTIDNIAIGWQEFYSCSGLTNAFISTNLTFIGPYAFGGCPLANIIIPNGVTNIEAGAFWFTYLQNVTIPDSVTTIGGGAFQGTDLTNIVIPSSVTSIGDIAFNDCGYLTNIAVDVSNLYFSSVNGILFDQNQTTLIQYPGGLGGSYIVPNGTASIGDDAFANCDLLTSVTLPNTVTNIGDGAFYECNALTNVYCQGNAPSADSVAFEGVPATIYYLPGTTGWSAFSTNANVPTALWLPELKTANASLGEQSNQFGFNINWASGQTVVVEASTNLANPIWSPLETITLTNSSVFFGDPMWTNYVSRFYRLMSP